MKVHPLPNCPQCGVTVLRHCDHCMWLECEGCKVIFGKGNYVYYGETKKTGS